MDKVLAFLASVVAGRYVSTEDAIEALDMAFRCGAESTPTPKALTADNVKSILVFIHNGQKIQAIKRYREATGLGLRESKDFVDSIAHMIREY